MGYYINPEGETKEAWLARNGQVECCNFNSAGVVPFGVADWKCLKPGNVFVCLVENTGFGFTAAGVAYDEREFNAFNQEDGRPKIWFQVPREKIVGIIPSMEAILA